MPFFFIFPNPKINVHFLRFGSGDFNARKWQKLCDKESMRPDLVAQDMTIVFCLTIKSVGLCTLPTSFAESCASSCPTFCALRKFLPFFSNEPRRVPNLCFCCNNKRVKCKKSNSFSAPIGQKPQSSYMYQN